jgi:hypothetical protein
MPESKSSCRTSLYVRRKYDFLFLCVTVAVMEVGSVSNIILCAVNLANIVLHRHSWSTGWCLLLCSLDAAYCCLIQLCRVEVLQLQLGLLVLLNWVVICCLLLFASTLQCWGPASAVGSVVTIPFQRAIIRLKRRSYAKVTTPGS